MKHLLVAAFLLAFAVPTLAAWLPPTYVLPLPERDAPAKPERAIEAAPATVGAGFLGDVNGRLDLGASLGTSPIVITFKDAWRRNAPVCQVKYKTSNTALHAVSTLTTMTITPLSGDSFAAADVIWYHCDNFNP